MCVCARDTTTNVIYGFFFGKFSVFIYYTNDEGREERVSNIL